MGPEGRNRLNIISAGDCPEEEVRQPIAKNAPNKAFDWKPAVSEQLSA
jgi:hypothetical protein